jgi:hypothetical protein
VTGGAICASPVLQVIDHSRGERPRIAAGAIGVAMQSTEAMQDEEAIGRITMRIERTVDQCDDYRRSLRADALARWLLDEWNRDGATRREAC